MTPVADILRNLLLDLGLGSEVMANDWSIAIGEIPEDPDNVMCIYDTSGVSDGRIMANGQRVEHPGVQIRVRSLDYWAGRNKAEEVALALDAVLRRDVSLDEESVSATYSVQNITRTGTVNALGAEESDRRRFHFTINAILTLRKVE